MFKHNKSVIVGSVFAPCEKNEFWYQTQIEFLKKTNEKFVHVVALNGDIDASLFSESIVIRSDTNDCTNDVLGINQSNNHSIGISKLIEYFRLNIAHCYLILDSDCFPIMKNWAKILISKMGNCKFSSPYRFENLDIFPHPCAFFIKGEYIFDKLLDFTPDKCFSFWKNTIDVGGRIPIDQCYPLVRSNVYNPHPIFSAVYNHIFYHHGCGSRALMPKSVLNNYFDHYMNKDFHLKIKDNLFDELKNNKIKFLNKLTGYNL